MAEQAWQAKDYMGLTPALDPRRANQVFVLDGSKNLSFTAAGPVSSFGNRKLLPQALGAPEHIQGIRIQLRTGDRSFTFTNDSILEWSEPLGGWKIIAMIPLIVEPYRWTAGYLNGVIYFCHPRTGIIELDLTTGVCQPIQGIGTPTQPRAITVNNGRLVVLTDKVIAWSWQSNGRNFTPALGEAGAQVLSARVAGFPIMLSNYAGGVLTWTTGGVLRSEFTGDQVTYRHRDINTEYRPINSFCVLQTDKNTAMILDERGIFKSQGEAPEPATPLFNEFLKPYIQENRLKLDQNLRIEYDFYRQQMYVCESLSRYNPLYERAFVLNPNLDKWSTFDERFFGLLPIVITQSQREGDYFGFVDDQGVARFWKSTGSREVEPVDETLNLYYPLMQKPYLAEEGTGVNVCSSSMTFGYAPSLQDGRAGYYPRDGESVAPANLTGLDATLRLGLIKFDGLNESFDQMAEVTSILIGNVVSGPSDVVSEDYNLIPDGVDDEDYNIEIGQVDLGVDPLNYVNHGLRLIGTQDGNSTFIQEEPKLTLFKRAARYYACSVPGVWHILEMTATDVGQAIHLRDFEMTATYAGRVG